jgi:hypothetical protein
MFWFGARVKPAVPDPCTPPGGRDIDHTRRQRNGSVTRSIHAHLELSSWPVMSRRVGRAAGIEASLGNFFGSIRSTT